MAKTELDVLTNRYHNVKRKGSDDSDCVIVEKVWRLYFDNQDNDIGSRAGTWLLARIPDKDANNLVKRIVYHHFYLNRNTIPKKHKKLFRETIKKLSKKKQKKIRLKRP